MNDILDQNDVQPQEIIDPAQEEQNVSTVSEPSISRPEYEDIQEKNWRAARNRMEEQSHQIMQLQHELELLRSRHSPQQEDPEEDDFLTDSERKLNQKIKSLEAMVKKNKVSEQDYVIDRLRGKYADFDEVLSPENIDYLKQNQPSLSKALASLKDDPYEQGVAAYQTLKNTEWFRNRHTMQDKERIDQNLKKPTSVQAVRKQGALAETNRFANGLTPELKKALQKEMADCRKGA